MFLAYDLAAFGTSELGQFLQRHEPNNWYHFSGEISPAKPFVILIGLSEKWVNVIAMNRGRPPTFQAYGYNVFDDRWGYGNGPVGARGIHRRAIDVATTR